MTKKQMKMLRSLILRLATLAPEIEEALYNKDNKILKWEYKRFLQVYQENHRFLSKHFDDYVKIALTQALLQSFKELNMDYEVVHDLFFEAICEEVKASPEKFTK